MFNLHGHTWLGRHGFVWRMWELVIWGVLEGVSGCNLEHPLLCSPNTTSFSPHPCFEGCDFLDEGPCLVHHGVPGTGQVLTAR